MKCAAAFLGGMLGAVAAPVAALALGLSTYAVGLAGLAVIVLWRHRENIQRLMAGKESRLGAKKDGGAVKKESAPVKAAKNGKPHQP